MIIQCPKCLTKFKMDDSKVKDEGTKVRCAKCKEVFVVSKEEAAPVPAPAPIQPEKSAEKEEFDFSFGSQAEEQGNEDSSFQASGGRDDQDIKGPETDFSFGDLPERETVPVEEKEGGIDFGGMAYGEVSFSEPDASASESQPAPSFDFNEGKISFGEVEAKSEEFHFEAPQDVAFMNPAETETSSPPLINEKAVTESVSPETGTSFSEGPSSGAFFEEGPRDEIDDELLVSSSDKKTRSSNVKKISLVVLICIVLAVPLWYFWANYKGAESGQINLAELNGHYAQHAEAGSIFVVTGVAVNNTNKPRSFFQIKGTLFSNKGEKLIQKDVYCGNVFSSKELATLPRAKIEEDLTNKVGSKLANINLAPGQSVPFTIIFFDLPKDTAEFSVEVVSSQIAS